MAINAYTGAPGSGKTYEVVANVILPALLMGRRVITNIAGLKREAIADYFGWQGEKVEDVCIIEVSPEDVMALDFWDIPKESNREHKGIKGGDLLILDEVWRFWDGFSSHGATKVPEKVLEFLRMHRHRTDENGVSADIVLITQTPKDIKPKNRDLIDQTFYMRKNKSVGSSSTYTVSIFDGCPPQLTESQRRNQELRKYDKRIFALYQSHSLSSAEGFEEKVIDARASVFKSSLIRIGIPIAAILILLPIWWLVGFFTTKKPTNTLNSETRQELPETQKTAPKNQIPAGEMVGVYISNGKAVYYVRGDDKQIKRQMSDTFSLNGRTIKVQDKEGF